jgi:hypothetical protein
MMRYFSTYHEVHISNIHVHTIYSAPTSPTETTYLLTEIIWTMLYREIFVDNSENHKESINIISWKPAVLLVSKEFLRVLAILI